MVPSRFWIEDLLTQTFPVHSYWKKIDLDRNGKITPNEIFDELDQKPNSISPAEYEAFLSKNRDALSQEIPFFKWGEKLNVINRLHQALYMDSYFESPQTLKQAYDFISEFDDKLRTTLSKKENIDPEDGIQTAYQVLKSIAYLQGPRSESSIAKNLATRSLDSETQALALLSIGDQRIWPLLIVPAPTRTLLRWNDPSDVFGLSPAVVFNFYNGASGVSDEYYYHFFRIAPTSKQIRDIYLRELDDQEYRSLLLTRLGQKLIAEDQFFAANATLAQAILLDSKNARAYSLQGICLSQLGESYFEKSLAAHTKALVLDPVNSQFHSNKGLSLLHMRKWKLAVDSLDSAINLDLLDHENMAAISNRQLAGIALLFDLTLSAHKE